MRIETPHVTSSEDRMTDDKNRPETIERWRQQSLIELASDYRMSIDELLAFKQEFIDNQDGSASVKLSGNVNGRHVTAERIRRTDPQKANQSIFEYAATVDNEGAAQSMSRQTAEGLYMHFERLLNIKENIQHYSHQKALEASEVEILGEILPTKQKIEAILEGRLK